MGLAGQAVENAIAVGAGVNVIEEVGDRLRGLGVEQLHPERESLATRRDVERDLAGGDVRRTEDARQVDVAAGAGGQVQIREIMAATHERTRHGHAAGARLQRRKRAGRRG